MHIHAFTLHACPSICIAACIPVQKHMPVCTAPSLPVMHASLLRDPCTTCNYDRSPVLFGPLDELVLGVIRVLVVEFGVFLRNGRPARPRAGCRQHLGGRLAFRARARSLGGTTACRGPPENNLRGLPLISQLFRPL